MFNVVIFGAPGSGKGTQSDYIVEKYGLVHLSTGDILREEIAKGSEVGKIAEGLISKGHFVPDDVIVENVHLSESLMRLSYNLSRYEKEHKKD